MLPDDRVRFVSELTALQCAVQCPPLTPEQIAVYWRALDDWTIDQFAEAVGFFIKTRTWRTIPLPGEFGEVRRQAGRITSGEAWDRVKRHVMHGNHRRGIKLDPTTELAVLAAGGYHAIGMCDEWQLARKQEAFAKKYDEAHSTEQLRAALPSAAQPALARMIEQTALQLTGNDLPAKTRTKT